MPYCQETAQSSSVPVPPDFRAPVEPAEHKKGLHGKYIIHRSRDGSPVDYPCFVLRLDGSDPAAMSAMRAYAEDPACPPELAGDLAVYCAIPAQVQPADGEVSELVADLQECADSCTLAEKHGWSRLMRRAANLLERLSTPQPVPVSERLPGPEDCDAEGRCWWWDGEWGLVEPRFADFRTTHWLPAHALPTPGDNQ
jgi:hypothetical protein